MLHSPSDAGWNRALGHRTRDYLGEVGWGAGIYGETTGELAFPVAQISQCLSGLFCPPTTANDTTGAPPPECLSHHTLLVLGHFVPFLPVSSLFLPLERGHSWGLA